MVTCIMTMAAWYQWCEPLLQLGFGTFYSAHLNGLLTSEEVRFLEGQMGIRIPSKEEFIKSNDLKFNDLAQKEGLNLNFIPPRPENNIKKETKVNEKSIMTNRNIKLTEGFIREMSWRMSEEEKTAKFENINATIIWLIALVIKRLNQLFVNGNTWLSGTNEQSLTFMVQTIHEHWFTKCGFKYNADLYKRVMAGCNDYLTYRRSLVGEFKIDGSTWNAEGYEAQKTEARVPMEIKLDDLLSAVADSYDVRSRAHIAYRQRFPMDNYSGRRIGKHIFLEMMQKMKAAYYAKTIDGIAGRTMDELRTDALTACMKLYYKKKYSVTEREINWLRLGILDGMAEYKKRYGEVKVDAFLNLNDTAIKQTLLRALDDLKKNYGNNHAKQINPIEVGYDAFISTFNTINAHFRENPDTFSYDRLEIEDILTMSLTVGVSFSIQNGIQLTPDFIGKVKKGVHQAVSEYLNEHENLKVTGETI